MFRIGLSLLLAFSLHQNAAQAFEEITLKSGQIAFVEQISNNASEPASTLVGPTARLLASNKQTAPYAFEDQADNEQKSVLFKLILNQTQLTNQFNADSAQEGQQPWTLTGQNGTVLGERASLDLKLLLEALDSNNLTSEVQFDDYRPGMINVTISNWRPGASDTGVDQGRELQLLNELLDESKFQPALNSSEVLRDNHRLITRQPVRVKPADSGRAVASLLVPPIRRNQDVVADNYTAKKIANEANIFALRLLEQLNIERIGNENIVNSPFSIYQALGLLMAGSMGDTLRELDKLLLGIQSVYENTKLTHDQDRARLMASFGDVLRQLQANSSNHFDYDANCQSPLACPSLLRALDKLHYRGGSSEQHFIVANNLLFSPSAYEISSEFKSTLGAYHNNTALTKMEVGSTESVQVVNGWIRQVTAGLIPTIISKKSTFDEFNVMTMLSTSWLAQEWRNSFRRVASQLRSSIRLKGQTIKRSAKGPSFLAGASDEPLMEFVDDQRSSHFVEYIVSGPTRSIHNYRTHLNKQLVDIVVVPFRDSNQCYVALTPLPMPVDSFRGKNLLPLNSTPDALPPDPNERVEPIQLQPATTETSLLTKMIANFANEPRKVLRQLWNTIASEIITKHTIQSMQAGLRQQTNSSGNESFLAMPMLPMVRLSMPLIKLEADASLSASLNHIGLVNAFDPAQANFIGINGHPFNYHKLHLSNVIYKTTFNLNEDGINYDRTVRTLESLRILPHKQQVKDQRQEANLEPGELINEVKLNRPHMFMVVDITTKLILYTGVVRNPAK